MGLGLGDPANLPVGAGNSLYLAQPYLLVQHVYDLFDRSVRIIAVKVVEVDPLHPKTVQAFVQIADNLGG